MNLKKTNCNSAFPFAKPEEAGFLQERLSRIRPGLQKFIDKKMLPNLTTMVVRHGKVVHLEAQGYLDLDKKQPVTKDTIYRLFSNTKPITGVATMICIEEGLLNLDDPVSKYLPAFKNQVVRSDVGQGSPMPTITVPARRGITVRDCLRNTTGLCSPHRAPLVYMNEFSDVVPISGVLAGLERPSRTIRETIEALAKLPLACQPGTQFEYHVGYPIVGLILEEVTGKPLEDFYQERIFKPLGMKDTSFYLPKNKIDRFPALYEPVFQAGKWKLGIVEKPETSEKVIGPKDYFDAGGGAGGVLSTITDYARFTQMLLNGGELDGVRILGRKTVELMTSSHTGNIEVTMPGPGFGFGLGVGVYKGTALPTMRSIGTYGWGGAAGTSCYADPKEDLIFACFTQVMTAMKIPGNSYPEEFERMVYQSLI